MMKKTVFSPWQISLICLVFTLFSQSCTKIESGKLDFNHGWQFAKDIDTTIVPSLFSMHSNFNWQDVNLPHTANIEPLVIEGDQWQGNCFYRKFFTIHKQQNGKHIAVLFEGAMHTADVYLNGEYLMTHYGGYLPFYVDITDKVKPGEESCLVVRLNNEDNPQVPPGKPIKTLDFNYYGGIYRNTHLIIKDKLHITNSVSANKVAGGGVFVSYDNVSENSADISVQLDVANTGNEKATISTKIEIKDENGKVVISDQSNKFDIDKNQHRESKHMVKLNSPDLWSPDNPTLYTLATSVMKDGVTIDQQEMRIGIRTFYFSATEGFVLNGKKVYIRGTNRHQDYPYIGYALSNEAQYRDAYKIKMAGYNFVRLSHYPHAEAFMDACDELGLMTMDAIPGWQFFGDSVFQDRSIQDVRDMVRRDRNHACVVLWEASLNESWMTDAYLRRAHGAVHEELPMKDVFTCGWMDSIYNVFIPARQHAKPPHYWNQYQKNRPIFIAEYGDWEYYAQNAGFNQTAYQDLSAEERTSRQLRGDGQIRLAQQALNYQEAHNSNLYGPAAGDANWLVFDYNRGYAPDIEASGVADIFRIPKFAYYFYQSQAGPGKHNEFYKPMVFISNFWNDPEFTTVKIYSNCDEVELYLNQELVGKQKPDRDNYTTNLNHPPFTFEVEKYEPGELKAIAYIDGGKVAESMQKTASDASQISLSFDLSNKPLKANVNDVVFVYASVTDDEGNLVSTDTSEIAFTVSGDAELIGQNPIRAEAGVATILLRAGKNPGVIEITATSEILAKGIAEVQSYE